MIWKFHFLHLQYDAVLEPVQICHLDITLRVEEDVVALIINVTTCHILRKLPSQRLILVIMVADRLNGSIFCMLSDLHHVDYL